MSRKCASSCALHRTRILCAPLTSWSASRGAGVAGGPYTRPDLEPKGDQGPRSPVPPSCPCTGPIPVRVSLTQSDFREGGKRAMTDVPEDIVASVRFEPIAWRLSEAEFARVVDWQLAALRADLLFERARRVEGS